MLLSGALPCLTHLNGNQKPILNYQRQSVAGLSIDFVVLNVLGYGMRINRRWDEAGRSNCLYTPPSILFSL